MLHDGSAVVVESCSSLETPKPSFSQPLSSFISNMTTPVNHAKPASIEWDWALEHADRKRESKADSTVHGVPPFHIDRNILRDVVKEKLECRVGRIAFLSSGAHDLFLVPFAQVTQSAPSGHTVGTFHKVCSFSISVHRSGAYRCLQAYSVTLSDGRTVIARVARRFMPRRKTESEVATMEYIRTYTSIPVPNVYFYDSNPYNRLGGEYIIMSKVGRILFSI
jgi:hypothetical protein